MQILLKIETLPKKRCGKTNREEADEDDLIGRALFIQPEKMMGLSGLRIVVMLWWIYKERVGFWFWFWFWR